LTLFFFLSK